ncbi:MAG: hypothetical protein AAGD38_02900 [Acidobacteriota bacterium]
MSTSTFGCNRHDPSGCPGWMRLMPAGHAPANGEICIRIDYSIETGDEMLELSER